MTTALIGAANTPVMSKNATGEFGMLSSISSVQPRSRAEHYWAVRALKAETLLSARITHHQELRTLTSEEELKRSVSSFRIHSALS